MTNPAREALAAAANTVPKIKVTPIYRQSIKTGDGFVRYAGAARAENGFGYVNKWEVWIGVPQDLATAEAWLDENVPALTAALETAMVVTDINPSTLVLGPNSVNGVIFAGSLGA